MIGSTVTTFGKIDNAERGTTCCVDLALTKYEAVILSLPSFRPKFFKKSFQQLSTTPLGDQLHCNLHDLITYSPLQLHYLVSFLFWRTILSPFNTQKKTRNQGAGLAANHGEEDQPWNLQGPCFFWRGIKIPTIKWNGKNWKEREVKSVPKVQIDFE